MDINVTDNAGFIDDEEGALTFPIRAQDAIQFGDFAMRPEVAEKWVVNPAKAFSPGDQTIGRVNAYTQNLGI